MSDMRKDAAGQLAARVAATELWCGLSADQLGTATPDLIVFPERVSQHEIDQAVARCPNAIIAGAISTKGFMRGVIWHHGRNQIDYLKVGNDGRLGSSPSPRREQPTIYESHDLAVGLLICMDFDIPAVRDGVIEQLHRSEAPFKALCVPADMYNAWFSTEPITPPRLDGIHVAVSNGLVHGDNRLRSFITDRKRMKDANAKQVDREPIRLWLGDNRGAR
jgi:hypothetical protein